MATKVLAFMAHPDDVEFNCAGTLARLKQEAGCEIAIATSTSGECGTMEARPDENARTRHAEAKAAAELLGAPYYPGGCADVFIMYDEPTLQRFIEVIRKVKPDIVITQSPVDYMVDHENTSRLVRTACFGAGVPNAWTRDPDPAPPFGKVPHLYYADPHEMIDNFGKPIETSLVVDITETMPIKEKMLRCHKSQAEWLLAHHKFEYIEEMKKGSAARGKTIDRPYAEGFRQHLGHPYPQNDLIAELLKLT